MNTYEGSVWLRGRRLSILEEMEEPGDYTPEERLGSALASMNETILCLIGKNSSGLPGIMGQATTALKIQGLMDAIRNERDQLKAENRQLRERVADLQAGQDQAAGFYNEEVAKNYSLDARVAELEAEVERLCERVAEAERSEDGPVRTSSADDPTGFQQIY